MLMGQAETAASVVQNALDGKSGQPSLFVEDMTPEERALYYKNVLKVL